MAIKDAKVKFIRLGMHAIGMKSTTIYIPTLEINFMEKEKKRKEFSLEECDVTKKNYRGVAVSKDFVVVCTTERYLVFSDNGELLAPLSNDIGQIISIDEKYFVINKDKSIYFYDKNGKLVHQRELTENEIKSLES